MPKKKKKPEPIEGMTWEEVAGKIDWEGGITEYFVHHGAGKILDPELKTLVDKLEVAYRELEHYLDDNGGLL